MMSQTETVLLIALGFAVATFFGLIIGRFAWKGALKLGAKRAMSTLPSTVVELQGERDRLRSENAMIATKLEMRLNDMRVRMAEQAAEVSRHRNRMQILITTVGEAETLISAKTAEVSALQEQVRTLQLERTDLTLHLDKMMAATQSLTGNQSAPAPLITASEASLSATPAKTTETNEPLQRRIRELTRLSEKMSKERESTDPQGLGSVIPALDARTVFVKPADSRTIHLEPSDTSLDQQVIAAEEASLQLQNELAKLDEIWSATEAEHNQSVAPFETNDKDAKTRRGINNVISLAKRIKALQEETKE